MRNQPPSPALRPTDSSVRGLAAISPFRMPAQFTQAQFHCGKPPPAADPRTRRSITSIHYSLVAMSADSGMSFNGCSFASGSSRKSSWYELISASIFISTNEGVPHFMRAPPFVLEYLRSSPYSGFSLRCFRLCVVCKQVFLSEHHRQNPALNRPCPRWRQSRAGNPLFILRKPQDEPGDYCARTDLSITVHLTESRRSVPSVPEAGSQRLLFLRGNYLSPVQ